MCRIMCETTRTEQMVSFIITNCIVNTQGKKSERTVRTYPSLSWAAKSKSKLGKYVNL